MRCTTVCPNDAFTFSGNAAGIPNSLENDTGPTVLSCPRQKQVYPEETLMPCLGGITLEHLLALGLAADKTIVAFNTSDCSGCVNNHSVKHFLHRLEFLKEKAGGILNGEFIVITEQKQLRSLEQLDRRSFLSGLKEHFLATISSRFRFSFESPEKEVISSRRIPTRVRLKKELLQHIGLEHKELISALLNHRLEVSGACDLCPLCTGICPTGAIRVDRAEGQKELSIDHTLCSGCGLCVTFCKQNAISLEGPIYQASRRKGVEALPPGRTPRWGLHETVSG
jgi:formate hydrogenlyase subunit 6/NADH:ubiquinone oxidoreductase subunit I